MSKKIKKIIVSVCSLALVACMSVGITLAYLQDTTGTVTNTFTYGNVSFNEALNGGLDEAKVNRYGRPIKVETTTDEEGNQVVTETEVELEEAERVTANTYKLIPSHEYVKDPTVHIGADSEDAWLFVKVVNGIELIEKEGTTTIASQMSAKSFVQVSSDPATHTYIYAYNQTVSAGENIVVFDNFTLADGLEEENIETYENASITIQAFIIQADGLDTYEEAWAAAGSAFPTT